MTTTLLEREATEERVLDTSDDPDQCAHIVMVPSGESDETPQAYVMRARVEGFPVVALCGYTWVPKQMAQGLPVCERCLAIYEYDPHGHNDRGELPDE